MRRLNSPVIATAEAGPSDRDQGSSGVALHEVRYSLLVYTGVGVQPDPDANS